MNNSVDYTKLGERIKQARETSNYTQEQLAEACLLSTSFIGHIERGTRTLSVDTLFKIATILNISVDYLLFDSIPSKNLLASINSILEAKDKDKVKRFLSIVKILADKIDEI